MAELDNKFLVEEFGKEKITKRYCFLYDLLKKFINSLEYSNDLIISSTILDQVITDYFTDIYRLKKFHEEIEYVNDIKIYSYLAYWVCRRKPIQIVNEDSQLSTNDASLKVELSFVNEKAMTSFLQSYLFSNPSDVAILPSKMSDYESFIKNMLYLLKYRHYTAQNIETILLSFIAGRSYQFSVDSDKG